MKIFLTGATGYVGTYLVRRLLKEGHTIHALVRTPSKASHIQSDQVILFKGDFQDKKALKKAMKDCQQVYHLGACTSVWEPDLTKYFALDI